MTAGMKQNSVCQLEWRSGERRLFDDTQKRGEQGGSRKRVLYSAVRTSVLRSTVE